VSTINIVLCGLGGQGILFMTRVLAQAALDRGFDIMGAETHGMAQRGGSVVSHLRLGEGLGSLVRACSAHFLFALEENEAYRNLSFLAPKGRLYVNADAHPFPKEEVKTYLEKKNIVHRAFPAGRMAQELGASMSSNLALLGFFSAFEEGPVSRDDLRATIEKISPDSYRDKNLMIFDAGLERGLKEPEA
jgi:indolepyruvate ferredoxin oxidoreductase, beta subunit